MNPFLRTALKPQWIAMLLVVLAAASGMAWLGSWQLARAREQGDAGVQVALARPPVQLTSVLKAQSAFPEAAVDRPVTVSGTWDTAKQIVIPDRYRNGRKGEWVLTPLVLADGSRLPVVRGWTDDASAPARSAAALGSAQVSITGVMRPGEETPPYEPGKAPAVVPGHLEVLDPVQLIEQWPTPIFSGYLVQTGSDAAAGGLQVVPPEKGNGQLALQNLSYAVQWWIFAALGLLFWFRLVRDDTQGVLGAQAQVGARTTGAGTGPGSRGGSAD